jgi:hypothetical protein
VGGLAATVGLVVAGAASSATAANPLGRGGPARHVLVVSVDGLHQSDVDWYVSHHPVSTLAALARGGVEYRHAQTTFPSDSFPGTIAQLTGGTPAVTGVSYDDTFNHALLPAGTTKCAGVAAGTEVDLTEDLDHAKADLDAGQGLPQLPGSILDMTGQPQSLINPAKLPVDPTTCKPVYPHQYLKVNTVFNVAKSHGMRTAWSDKHPAYEILNGPSGNGIDDLFTPEINSQAIGYPAGEDWTSDNAATQQYDAYKVRAIVNEIDGYDHSGRSRVGTPAIFGMNFQSVSTAQKLPTSDGLTGGYLPGGKVPGPLLSGALDFVDRELGAMVSEVAAQGLAGSTSIIVSAKHGQSPTDPAALTRIPDGPILTALNKAWTDAHPGAGDLVAFSTDDDIMQLWLTDRSAAATAFVRQYLLAHSAAGNTVSGASRTLPASGLSRVYAGAAAAQLVGVPAGEPRHPDVIGIVQHGVVYTSGAGKIAEHGGADPQDRDVPLLVAGAGVGHGRTVDSRVQTTQIAPTILRLLGLDPHALKAVREQGTRTLPGLQRNS